MDKSNSSNLEIKSIDFVKYIIDRYKYYPPLFYNMPTPDELCLAYLKEKISDGLKKDIDSKLIFARKFISLTERGILKKKFVNDDEFIFEYVEK